MLFSFLLCCGGSGGGGGVVTRLQPANLAHPWSVGSGEEKRLSEFLDWGSATSLMPIGLEDRCQGEDF